MTQCQSNPWQGHCNPFDLAFYKIYQTGRQGDRIAAFELIAPVTLLPAYGYGHVAETAQESRIVRASRQVTISVDGVVAHGESQTRQVTVNVGLAVPGG
ncbi:hypothetical protein Aple_011990 [Acrocarpospora pleiomorpha]|uniref:Uncharacterized protein n=1 Tax=Acrocarpospora pleiomorpha TaxID=90975 RepID=A0A5M3XAX9_9ACTN|nr:hypothetical protein [Acrocarpospora pleiomorpha]GES18304.1 hypothetical protein Aple_011990 [Acrocarpospora pleiomorpha]